MNTPSPLVPQGSLPGQAKGKTNLRIAVFTILSIHVVLLGGLLLQGCKKEDSHASTAAVAATNDFPSLTDTNYFNASSIADTNGATSVSAAPAATTTVATTLAPVNNALPAPTTPATGREYVVVKGDSFAKIAKANGVSLKAVTDANPGVDSTKLRIGQKLQLPGAAVASATVAAPEAGTTIPSDASGATYVVKTGDNLTAIARKQGTSVKAIKLANSLKTDQLKVGQKLKLPAAKTAVAKLDVPTPATLASSSNPISATPSAPVAAPAAAPLK